MSGLSVSIDINTGYQGWEGQFGTTKIHTPRHFLFFVTLLALQKMVEKHRILFFQSSINASMAHASGSLFQEQNLLILVLFLEANKSISGWPHLFTILNAKFANSHSVSMFVLLDSLSASVFSCEGNYPDFSFLTPLPNVSSQTI